ncbi:hypothetical protein AAIB41_12330 [Brucella sp. BE17]|uniref:hypothetical protein n=1 Tax=Brucella sp. BE17 TaxID=3142977 RepID=UPI0031BBC57E
MMNMQLQHKQAERRDKSSRAVSYLPRIMLGVLGVLLVVLLVWSLTGGGTFNGNDGVQTPPETQSPQGVQPAPPAQSNRPETGSGGEQPAAPDPSPNTQ